MALVAKFKVHSVMRSPYYDRNCSELETVVLHPVGMGEDAVFGDATPSGELNMGIANPEAQGQLRVGQVVRVRIDDWPEGS